jgi:hypothetical protein
MSGVLDCQLEMHPTIVLSEKCCTFWQVGQETSKFGRQGMNAAIPVVVARFGGIPVLFRMARGLAPNLRHLYGFILVLDGQQLRTNSPKKEQRKWTRLRLAIPVFVRSRDENGKELLEFATAVNISAGGALVVVRRSLPRSSPVSLEIPSAPIGPAHGVRSSSRAIRAKTVWVAHLNDYHLLGLKFGRPLSTDAVTIPSSRLRKARSAM